MKALRYRPTDVGDGFTLIEILMVVVILGILATVALRSVQSTIESSRVSETQKEMEHLSHAIAGNPNLYNNGMRSDFGYVGDVGAVPAILDDLLSNPGGYATWDGPYVSGRFTEDAAGFKTDAWGNAYSFTNGITISSTGGGSTPLTTSVASAASDLTANPVAGSLTDAAGNPPGDSAVAIDVIIDYPDGVGSMTSSTVNPNSGGGFTFSGIPIGNHLVRAIYRATDDTVTAYTSVLPRTGSTLTLRLPGDPFAGGGGGGGGGTPGSIEYVEGSAATTGIFNDDVEFDIINPGDEEVTITWLIAEFSPTAYFQRIRWGGANVFNESNPKAASGDTCVFTSPQALGAGSSVEIDLEDFRDSPVGGWGVDMSNTDFTITFSDGSAITFNSGT